MQAHIRPRLLSGEVQAIESKSAAHRLLICAAVSDIPTQIRAGSISKDIAATASCLEALGCSVAYEGGVFSVTPVPDTIAHTPALNCSESGSTLRFLLPVAAAVCDIFTMTGSGRLPQRPLTPLMDAMRANGCAFSAPSLPFEVSGRLRGGCFELPGTVSSQFISGLLMALPLLPGGGEIRVTGEIQSSGYIDMTLAALAAFGVEVEKTSGGYRVEHKGRFSSPGKAEVEGDWSAAAFWLAAGALGGPVACGGLDGGSLQKDMRILGLLAAAGAQVLFEDGTARVEQGSLKALRVDAAEIPDLVPVLAAVLCFAQGTSRIENAGRLRFKESDRLEATVAGLSALGADIRIGETGDSLVITGKESLAGGKADCAGDHRIAMALAVASCRCMNPVEIGQAESVEKSYPAFFRDFNNLGGEADVV